MDKLDHLRRISFSRWKVLKKCGMHFYLQYVKNTERDPSHPSSLYGLTVHKTFEEWFSTKSINDINWLYLNYEMYFAEYLTTNNYNIDTKEKSQILTAAREGIDNLLVQLEKNNQVTPKTKAEAEVYLLSKSYLMNGKIDYFTVLDSRTAIISDAKGYKSLDYLDTGQIVLYAYLIHRLLGIDRFEQCGYLCFHPKVNKFVPITIDLSEGEALFNQIIFDYNQILHSRDFSPKPEFFSCLLCDVYSKCGSRYVIKKKELTKDNQDTILEIKQGKHGSVVAF